MTTSSYPIAGHPDLMEMRAQYEEAAETATARALVGGKFLVGLFVAISPWVVGFAGTGAVTISNLITGLALATLAWGFASAYGRTHNLAWTTPLIGAWILVSPWTTVGAVETTGMIFSNVIAGGLIVLLGTGLLITGEVARRKKG